MEDEIQYSAAARLKSLLSQVKGTRWYGIYCQKIKHALGFQWYVVLIFFSLYSVAISQKETKPGQPC